MALVVTVGGTDRTTSVRQFELRRPINGIGVGSMSFVDRSGSSSPWTPAMLAEVIVAVDGTTQFRGRILTRETAFVVENRRGFVKTDVQLADVNDRCNLELLNMPVAGGALKTILQAIMGNLASQNISLYGSQPDGPLLDNQLFAWVSCREALDHLSTLTGWVWRVDEALELRMWQIGSRSSGVAYSEANRNIRKCSVGQDATNYRNIQWLVYGPTQDGVPIQETWNGNGSLRLFPFSYTLNGGTPPNVVTRSDTSETLPCGPDTGWEWSYDSVNNRIMQTGGTPIANGHTLTASYTCGFPQYVVRTASDIGYPNEVTDNGRWMRKDEASTIFDYMEARNTADALIRNNRPRPERLTLTTGDGSAVDPGETVSVSVPELGIATADFLVTGTTARYSPAFGGGHRIEYELELIGGSERQADWVTFWRDVLGPVTGGGGTIAGGAIGGGSSVPAVVGNSYMGGSRVNAMQTPAGEYRNLNEYVDIVLDSTKVPAIVYLGIEIRLPDGNGTTNTATPQVVAGSGAVDAYGRWSNREVRGTGTPINSTTTYAWQSVAISVKSGIWAYRVELACSHSGVDAFAAGAVLQW